VGIYDDFFSLGGHSLLVAQVFSRIRETFQVELPLRTLFNNPTVAGLADKIEQAMRAREGKEMPPEIEMVQREAGIPLSFAQERLWLVEQLQPNTPAYNVPVAVRIEGDLDRAALEYAMTEVERRHETLQTNFQMVSDGEVKIVHAAGQTEVGWVDLSGMDEKAREENLLQLVRSESERPFNLQEDKLYRVTLYRLQEENYLLLLVMHHLVTDEWSMRVLIRELTALYQARREKRASPLPELRVQYADYAVWQRKWLQGKVLEREMEYWRNQLKAAPMLDLPLDRQRPEIASGRGAVEEFELTRETTKQLKELSRSEGVTLFMTLVAALQALLGRYSGQDDIVVGTPIANRNHVAIEGLIGFFANTLVLRTDLSGNPSFRQLLRRVREVALAAYAHQDAPFEKLVQELQPERMAEQQPLFQVAFALRSFEQDAFELAGLKLIPYPVGLETAKFDLTINMGEAEGRLGGSFTYSTDLFTSVKITGMAGHYRTLLESIVANPQQRILDLEMTFQAEDQESYWLQKLAGEIASGRLPIDRKMRADSLASREIVLPSHLVEQMHAVCKDDVAIFSSLVGAAAICLHQYSGSMDVLMVTPVCRERGGSSNSLLVLRVTLDGAASLGELLGHTRQTIVQAYSHQGYPFSEAAARVRGRDGAGGRDKFALGIAWAGLGEEQALKEMALDLNLVFRRTSQGIQGTCAYDVGLYKEQTMAAFCRHFEQALQRLIFHSGAKLASISIAGEEEDQTRVNFNKTETPFPAESCVHDLIKTQAIENPESVAVVCGERELSYRQLNQRADIVAGYLQAQGIRAGMRVAICMEHSPEMIIALLALWKTGAAYVPIDPEYPSGRIQYILSDCGAPLALIDRALESALAGSGVRTLCWDDLYRDDLSGDEAQPGSLGQSNSGNLAYIIYTSGSTGTPKGVKIAHRALVNYLWWAREAYVRGQKLGSAFFASLTFDFTVTSLWLPLVTGNQVVVYPRALREYAIADTLDEILVDKRVGILKLTPSHLSLIKDRNNRSSGVRRLIVGGEALHTQLACAVYESFGGEVEIFNEYGPTEATVGCMIHQFDPFADDGISVPIGRPAANTQIYVLDEQQRMVPDMVIGELYIAGEGLAEGYLNQDDLTAQKFIENRFRRGQRMYQTGDLARYLPGGGMIECLGRKDDQVKYHGYRVELGEIRNALNGHSLIRDSAVLVEEEQNGNPVLLAYYVSRQELDPGQLREFLAGMIMAPIIPTFFCHLKKLPLTINGKLNTRALPTVAEIKERVKRSYSVTPSTPLEQKLAALWKKLLSVEEVGVDQNFFQMGAHSLLMARMHHEIRRTLSLDLSIVDLFRYPTIQKLAAFLEESGRARALNNQLRAAGSWEIGRERLLAQRRQRQKSEKEIRL